MNKTRSLGITSPRGFRAAGGTCGIKVSGAPDLTLIVADQPCAAAGVFTTNQMCSAPVKVDKRHLAAGKAQAIICNSGNANASTGKPGEENAIAMCRLVAQHAGLADAHLVLPSSTGIIGRPLPMDKIAAGIAQLAGALARGPKAAAAAARGIMTTDLIPKTASAKVTIAGKEVLLAGIAKGSGMIAPNLATMLVFLTSDAAISPAVLSGSLQQAAKESFNRISVDQHTSPSDTVLMLCSGQAGNRPIAAGGAGYRAWLQALTAICRDLAYQIILDGEGATKVIRLQVVGAASETDADRVGRAVVDSPLVKTAVHGGDPNWGRIVTAAGYSGAKVREESTSLHIGPERAICVYAKGLPQALDKKSAATLNKLMKAREVVFTLDLGLGKTAVEWLGCDLSRQYIAINADYTT